MSLRDIGLGRLGATLLLLSLALAALSPAFGSGQISAQAYTTADWSSWATTAWKYYAPGMGVNSATGLHKATLAWTCFTDWDLGSYIYATIYAEKLRRQGVLLDNLPQTGTWSFDYRITKVLDFLKARPLGTTQGLDAAYLAYRWDVSSGQYCGDTGTALSNRWDAARLLAALNALKVFAPSTYNTKVGEIVARMSIISQWYTQVGTVTWYNYQAAEGYAAFGYSESVFNGIDNYADSSGYVSVYGQNLPKIYNTLSEPIIHVVLENDLALAHPPNAKFLDFASRVYLAQSGRSTALGKLTAWSEGSYPSDPYYIYEFIIPRDVSQTWKIVNPDGNPYPKNPNPTPLAYAKVAFAYLALYGENTYTLALINAAKQLTTTSQGFGEASLEDGSPAIGTGKPWSPGALGFYSDKTNEFVLAAASHVLSLPPPPSKTLTTGVDSGQGSVSPNCPSPNGCSETVGQSVTVAAYPGSGWQFASWSTQTGVSCSSNPCTFNMPNNAVTLKATFTQSSTGGISYFHPYTEFWFSRYDMKNAQWDAIHIVNVGTGTASIQITCASDISDSLNLGQGATTYRTYSGKACGPLHIVSTQPIWATQRILGWTAMQEIYGMPGDVADTDIISTWYDLVYASSDDVWVINPSTSATASVDISVAGVKRGSTLTVGPGQEVVASFPGVIGGPLRITSSIPVFASQRVIGFGDFAEIIALPSWYTFTETWFNWYDMKGAQWDAIHMLNPGSTAANVKIYVGGTLQASLSLASGAADYRSFPGVIGGPVRVVSDQPIWVTQRIIGWGGWKEVFGVPTTLATTDWYFTWYDLQYAQWDAIHLTNPGTSDAQVQVYVGGQLRDTITLQAGEATYVQYPGVMAGPVRIVSTVPIMSSQRILGWQSFEETIGVSLS